MNRRLFLRSAAATLWLPWLPSALPRQARAASAAAPRLVFWFVPNGFVPDGVAFRDGTDELPSTFAALAPLRGRTSVLTLDHATPGTPASHDHAAPALLTDHRVPDIHAPTLQGAISADQVVARTLGSVTPFPSLQLGTPAAAGPGLSQFDAYVTAISWANATTPLRPLVDPKLAFDRMFAGSDPRESAAAASRRAALRTSVLDAVQERIQTVSPTLSGADRQKLDQYATAVRELEQRLELLSTMRCERPDPPMPNLSPEAAVPAMNALIALALSCDYTRVITFMGGPSTSMGTFPGVGVREPHHVIAHGYPSSEEHRTQLLALERWYVQHFASLAQRLAEIPGEDGDNLLSSTALTLVTEFGEGSIHEYGPLTAALVGAERSGVVHGRSRAPGRPFGDLLRALIAHMGVDGSGFGESGSGALELG